MQVLLLLLLLLLLLFLEKRCSSFLQGLGFNCNLSENLTEVYSTQLFYGNFFYLVFGEILQHLL